MAEEDFEYMFPPEKIKDFQQKEQELKELKPKFETLENELKEVKKQIPDLQLELENAKVEAHTSNAKCQDLQNQLANCQQNLKQAKDREEELLKQMKKPVSSNQDQSKTIQEMTEKLAKMQKQLEQVSASEKKVALEHQATLNKLKQTQDDLVKEQSKKLNSNNYQTQIDKLNQEINKLKEENKFQAENLEKLKKSTLELQKENQTLKQQKPIQQPNLSNSMISGNQAIYDELKFMFKQLLDELQSRLVLIEYQNLEIGQVKETRKEDINYLINELTKLFNFLN